MNRFNEIVNIDKLTNQDQKVDDLKNQKTDEKPKLDTKPNIKPIVNDVNLVESFQKDALQIKGWITNIIDIVSHVTPETNIKSSIVEQVAYQMSMFSKFMVMDADQNIINKLISKIPIPEGNFKSLTSLGWTKQLYNNRHIPITSFRIYFPDKSKIFVTSEMIKKLKMQKTFLKNTFKLNGIGNNNSYVIDYTDSFFTRHIVIYLNFMFITWQLYTNNDTNSIAKVTEIDMKNSRTSSSRVKFLEPIYKEFDIKKVDQIQQIGNSNIYK